MQKVFLPTRLQIKTIPAHHSLIPGIHHRLLSSGQMDDHLIHSNTHTAAYGWMLIDPSVIKRTVAPYYMKTFQENLNNRICSHSHDPGLNYCHLLNPRYRSITKFCSPGKWDLPLWADRLLSEMRHVSLIMLKCSLFTLELKFTEGLHWLINCTLFLYNINAGIADASWLAAVSWHLSTSTFRKMARGYFLANCSKTGAILWQWPHLRNKNAECNNLKQAF